MFTKAIIVLAVAAQAFANVFITSPTASTTFTGGQQATITWMDDGQTPTLKAFGPAKISVYVGNALQQTSLQVIAPSVDVSTITTVAFTVDPTIGPNSSEYFIRVESLSLKDATQPQYPALAFSAKFTLAGMTGTFSPAISSQIAGQATAPLASQAPAPTGAVTPTTGSPAAVTTSAPHSGSSSGSAATPSKTAAPASGALSVKAGWAGVIFGVLAGVALF